MNENTMAYDETKAFLDDDERSETPEKPFASRWSDSGCRVYWKLVLPWAVTTCISLIVSTYLAFSSCYTRPGRFATDFAPVRSVIEYEERMFSGALNYNVETRRVERMLRESDPLYFGLPNKEIDDNWAKLLKGQYPVMTAEEAASFEPELTPIPNDNEFHFQLDVFHSLHCLNEVRKWLDAPYYQDPANHALAHHHANLTALSGQDDFERLHMDHCLDQLMQSVQCHGDLSPVPLYHWKGFKVAIGKGTEHTCRKWEPIKEWMDERNRVMKPLLDD